MPSVIERPICWAHHASRAALLAGAAVLAGCGSTADKVKPDPIPHDTVIADQTDDEVVVVDAHDEQLLDEEEQERRRLEEEMRQREIEEEIMWEERNRNCDMCPYGAPPPPSRRAIV